MLINRVVEGARGFKTGKADEEVQIKSNVEREREGGKESLSKRRETEKWREGEERNA